MRDFYVHFMSRRYEFLEMEKGQIETAFDTGYTCGHDEANGDGEMFESAEQYYSQTFKND